MLQNGLDPDGKLTCIDTFQGSEEHAAMGLDLNELFETFKSNVEEGKVADQHVEAIRSTSYEGLAQVIRLGDMYDFIYVDGSHTAPDVMTDACMAFGLLKPGGIMLFDDYLWNHVPGILHRPKLAVDLFVTLFSERAELLMLGYQLAVRKI
jgi:predicted O-methyltransferase YrrM